MFNRFPGAARNLALSTGGARSPRARLSAARLGQQLGPREAGLPQAEYIFEESSAPRRRGVVQDVAGDPVVRPLVRLAFKRSGRLYAASNTSRRAHLQLTASLGGAAAVVDAAKVDWHSSRAAGSASDGLDDGPVGLLAGG
jgi:hypothetical protein